MLALAKPKLENGDWSENEENEEEEEITKPKPTIYDSLKRPEDMDLTGSFSARDRRREKQVCDNDVSCSGLMHCLATKLLRLLWLSVCCSNEFGSQWLQYQYSLYQQFLHISTFCFNHNHEDHYTLG